MASTSEPRVVPELGNRYDDLLNKHMANYSNVLSSFGSAQKNLSDQIPGINLGYEKLKGDIGSSYGQQYKVGAEDIAATNKYNLGKSILGMISNGFGSSTMRANLARRVAEDTNRQQTRLNVGLGAAQSQDLQRVGLAGLDSRRSLLAMQTGLQQSMGGTLAGIHFNNPFGNILGQYSRSDTGGGYAPAVSGSAMGGGGPMGGVSGLEGMLGGLGGGGFSLGRGGGGGSLTSTNPTVYPNNYWSGGQTLGANIFGGGATVYPGGYGSETNPAPWTGLGDLGTELDPEMYG